MSTSITKATTILPNSLTYAATKGAVEQFTRVLAKDLGSRQITVNTVSPGMYRGRFIVTACVFLAINLIVSFLRAS
jgi:NAD(P)-dependent dehydrogenase (short-subunit alcohol dehydrogenase family)